MRKQYCVVPHTDEYLQLRHVAVSVGVYTPSRLFSTPFYFARV